VKIETMIAPEESFKELDLERPVTLTMPGLSIAQMGSLGGLIY